MNPKYTVVWCMFYSSVVSMQYHPGNVRDQKSLSLEQCADIADEMLEQLLKREDVWRG